MAGIGGRIKTALDARGLQAADLARLLRVNSGVVSKWLGNKQAPRFPQLVGICKALGISGHWLLTETGPMNGPGAEVIAPYDQAMLMAQTHLRETLGASVREALAPLYDATSGESTEEARQAVDLTVERPRLLPQPPSPPAKGQGKSGGASRPRKRTKPPRGRQAGNE